jgi:hypothetical protein
LQFIKIGFTEEAFSGKNQIASRFLSGEVLLINENYEINFLSLSGYPIKKRMSTIDDIALMTESCLNQKLEKHEKINKNFTEFFFFHLALCNPRNGRNFQ